MNGIVQDLTIAGEIGQDALLGAARDKIVSDNAALTVRFDFAGLKRIAKANA